MINPSTRLPSPTCALNRIIDELDQKTSNIKITGRFLLKNTEEKILSEITILNQSKKMLDNVMNIFSKKEERKPTDPKNELTISIYKRIGKEKLLFAQGHGNYARYLEIGRLIFYQHSKTDFPLWTPEKKEDYTLPSSSIMRKDLELIANGKFEDAQK